MNVVPPVPTPARDTKADSGAVPLVIRQARVVVSRNRADVIWA